ncbi:MAG: nucleotide disphospho-sugar-binding domain-containing protein, partial [Pseudonocardia sediminis]
YLFTDQPWVAVEPVLCPWQAPDGLGVVWTTAWLLPDRRPLPADVVAFLDAGAPPAYIGFGSMRVDPQTVHATVGAARDRGLRVLLHRGRSTLPPLTDDGDDVLVIGDVNQQALFPRVAVAVHHGGAGTTTAAARAGVPQLVLPQAADQPDWAARIAELEIGTALSAPTDESLAAAFDTALSPRSRARAGAVAATMGDDGADTAAAMLLAVGDETEPVDRR